MYSHNYLENQNLLQLYESNDSSLIGQEGNKFYLNPDRVSISQSGMIYLHSDLYGNLPIPFLSYDNHGLHTMAFVFIFVTTVVQAIALSLPLVLE